MRVLVVEDDENVGQTFGDMLLELGHQPVVVGSAEAALEILRGEPPDAMILDIQLPGMSGLDLLKLHPVRDSGVPVIAVSGVITEAQARDCLQLGALDFLRKPVPLDYLAKVLTSLDLYGTVEGSRRWAERRRSPRTNVAVPVRMLRYDGAALQGTSVDLSVSGMRVRSTAPLSRDAAVILSFTLPDGRALMSVPSIVARVDPDGYGFTFANLLEGDLEQLGDFTRAAVAA